MDERTERVVIFDRTQEAKTDGQGALLVGSAYQPGHSWKPDVIYAPGTWDRAERAAEDEATR